MNLEVGDAIQSSKTLRVRPEDTFFTVIRPILLIDTQLA